MQPSSALQREHVMAASEIGAAVRLARGAIAATLAITVFAGSAFADAVEDFYRGRQVTVIISGSVGSTYDIGTRIVVKHMSRYIPGRPSFVIKVMTGAGHLIAANHLYNVAERDGSVIGSVGETIPMAQFLTPARVKFDAGKFNWIGNPAVTNTTIMTWHASGIRTLADATKREVVIGATGAGSPSAQLPQILNNVLGTRFKIINGFTGTAIELAMERGEVDARGSVSLNRLKSIRREWMAQKKLNLLVQIGLRKDPDFAELPLLIDYARNEAERRIFRFMSSSSMIGRPVLAPPGIPAERIAALRKAFAMTMQDRDFLDEMAKLGLDVDPVHADELQAVVAAIAGTSPEDAAAIKAAHAVGRSFNCKEVVKDLKLCAGAK
jgi:tripartite-type tricarboxylate transporter receptor subunit TctC